MASRMLNGNTNHNKIHTKWVSHIVLKTLCTEMSLSIYKLQDPKTCKSCKRYLDKLEPEQKEYYAENFLEMSTLLHKDIPGKYRPTLTKQVN